MENIKLITSGYMKAGKPLISILMAVYEPRLDWFREQLCSLEAQTYPNLTLYIRDDGSQAVPFSMIEDCVRDTIHSFPYEIRRNEKNLGSNATFEKLTAEAEGAYFAYCDQDDIWMPHKLETLQKEIEQSGALLVCSDMLVIDGEGRKTANSITEVRRHHVFQSGVGLAENLLFHNFVTGCTMLLRSDHAKAAIPFCPYMVHDHYLALWCAAGGAIESLHEPLIQYRIHGSNQTELLAGITNKQSYGEIRIDAMLLRFQWLYCGFPCSAALRKTMERCILWLEARAANWRHDGGKRLIWKHRGFDLWISVFELLAVYLPNPIFRLFIICGQRNWI